MYYGVVERDIIREGVGDPFRGWRDNGHRMPPSSAVLLAPSEPSKIVAVEMKKALPEEPLLFIKPTAVIGPGEEIVCPPVEVRIEDVGALRCGVGSG
jgi:hypothetical protein